ncbi:3-dehydroquinate synthase II [Sinorhizobium medicae]|uniref:3-dehydroquinate synthase II n=1 Tax=Sinorhizobium medicae TaxID=110321 RepID=UPI000FD8AD55|nr:3-dehydroquinate synthase II [Sinorhizobium medicae]RVJ22242.1 3-dehydroquinate synthase [Sinorhizobium medicae]
MTIHHASAGLSAKSDPGVWFDTAAEDAATLGPLLERVAGPPFSAILLYPNNAEQIDQTAPGRLRRVLQVDSVADLANAAETARLSASGQPSWIVASRSAEVLEEASAHQFERCLRAEVANAGELRDAIALGRRYPWLLLQLKDVTNIPLELAIATLQGTSTRLVRIISDPLDVDGAVLSLGVMESGPDCLMFSPRTTGALDAFLERLESLRLDKLPLSTGTVLRTSPMGMGHRSCVDLVTIFDKNEGMLVGSTSHGGLLCCPEVFPMPYMDLRPFRVNAGAVHSYVYGPGGRTNYLSELRAGTPAMVVGIDGTTRTSRVGRVKTEIRPLRLIEVGFKEDVVLNLFLQDDWHVRIYSDRGQPICLSDLKAGDRILGHLGKAGRHVGLRIDETIVER